MFLQSAEKVSGRSISSFAKINNGSHYFTKLSSKVINQEVSRHKSSALPFTLVYLNSRLTVTEKTGFARTVATLVA